MTQKNIDSINADIKHVESVYKKLLKILPSFEIASSENLPYGLKLHTRSVSWIVEQVITQQTKFKKESLGLSAAEFNMPDTCLHNCEIAVGEKQYWINIKIHNMDKKHSKSDIAAVEKLYDEYTNNPGYNLIYACFGIRFNNNSIEFDPDYLKIFSPQFLPIYVNPRNDKIQAHYHHQPISRTREEFLKLLVSNSSSVALQGMGNG